MTQWHPLFAQLLRPLLESYYEIQTNVAVGDAPRQADVLLLRRTSRTTPPFQGLWRWLTTWNVVEFKGPTVSARVDDLDALLELGLGIHRRLNEQRAKEQQPQVGRSEVSFWYMANHLGRRFLNAARGLAGALEELAAGVWRTTVWQRSLLLVSNRAVPVDRDSLPIHLLTPEPEATQQEVVRVLGAHRELWPSYAAWLAGAHPELMRELTHMGRKKAEAFQVNVRPLFEHLGWQEILRQVGVDALVANLTPQQRQEILRQTTMEDLVAQLTPDQRREILRRIELEELVAQLTAEQRQEVLRLLQEEAPSAGQGRRRR
jgi:hypothetical protein